MPRPQAPLYLVPLLALLLAPPLAAQPAELALLADMARFDRALIPTLWWTGRGVEPKAEAATARLEEEWTVLLETTADHELLASGEARADLEAAGERIDEAVSAVGAGELAAAHEALEAVRRRLLAVRNRLGLPYFPDRLTEFHEPMEAIVRAAREGARPDGDPAAAAGRIAGLVEEARERWATVEASPLVPGIHRLGDEELAYRERLLAAERRALEALEAAVEAGEPGPILEAAEALKPPLARLVLLFGDVERPAGP